MQQLMRGIRINVRNLLLELLITLPVLLLNLIPVIGSIIATVILFLTQSYYAGFGNMDYTLERHFGYGDSVYVVFINSCGRDYTGITYICNRSNCTDDRSIR